MTPEQREAVKAYSDIVAGRKPVTSYSEYQEFVAASRTLADLALSLMAEDGPVTPEWLRKTLPATSRCGDTARYESHLGELGWDELPSGSIACGSTGDTCHTSR